MNLTNINSFEKVLLNKAKNKYLLEHQLSKVTHSEIVHFCLNKYLEDI